MSTGIAQVLSTSKTIVNCPPSTTNNNCQLSIDEVSKFGKEIAVELNNPGYKDWYCGIIYDFGITQVNEWKRIALSKNTPGRYFSTLVREARKQKNRS